MRAVSESQETSFSAFIKKQQVNEKGGTEGRWKGGEKVREFQSRIGSGAFKKGGVMLLN